MDAVEDREVKLQKASAELLAEFKTSLPRYLWVSQTKEKRIQKESILIARSIVKILKTNDLISLVC